MSVSGPHFSRLSRDALTEVARVRLGLPADLREVSEPVTVVCEMAPDAGLLDGDEAEEDLLGLFVGEAYNEQAGDMPMPPQIYLFLANLWDFSHGDPRIYLREVRKTYIHELGHYLGLSEEELDARGLQ